MLKSDLAVDYGEAWKGKGIPFRFNPDRFVFFFRDQDELYFLCFVVREGVTVDASEIIRLITGNRPIKPRRSELYGSDIVSPEAILSRAKAAAELESKAGASKSIEAGGSNLNEGINK